MDRVCFTASSAGHVGTEVHPIVRAGHESTTAIIIMVLNLGEDLMILRCSNNSTYINSVQWSGEWVCHADRREAGKELSIFWASSAPVFRKCFVRFLGVVLKFLPLVASKVRRSAKNWAFLCNHVVSSSMRIVVLWGRVIFWEFKFRARDSALILHVLNCMFLDFRSSFCCSFGIVSTTSMGFCCFFVVEWHPPASQAIKVLESPSFPRLARISTPCLALVVFSVQYSTCTVHSGIDPTRNATPVHQRHARPNARNCQGSMFRDFNQFRSYVFPESLSASEAWLCCWIVEVRHRDTVRLAKMQEFRATSKSRVLLLQQMRRWN